MTIIKCKKKRNKTQFDKPSENVNKKCCSERREPFRRHMKGFNCTEVDSLERFYLHENICFARNTNEIPATVVHSNFRIAFIYRFILFCANRLTITQVQINFWWFFFFKRQCELFSIFHLPSCI